MLLPNGDLVFGRYCWHWVWRRTGE